MRQRLKAGQDSLLASQQYRPLRSAVERTQPQSKKLAIVIHLFYEELWPTFSERLALLEDVPFDLFVSIPIHKTFKADLVHQNYPQANVYKVPNRGRDVLPFLRMMELITKGKYEYILKLHSKKSPQRKEGSKWASELLNDLIPASKRTRTALLTTLDDPKTGMIGPAGNYLPLTTYYEDNHLHISKILRKVFSKSVVNQIINNKEAYGFFAGTMFWARVDALKPLIDAHFKVWNFAAEAGQLDGTFAHALERVFCLASEIANRELYELQTAKLVKIPYSSKVSKEHWDASAANS